MATLKPLYVNTSGAVSEFGTADTIPVSAVPNDIPLSRLAGQEINAQSGNYTLVVADSWKLVRMNGNNVTLTVPNNTTAAIAVGVHIDVAQFGTGNVTIAAGSGVTLRSRNGLKLAGQYAGCTLIKVDTNEWLIVGDLTT